MLGDLLIAFALVLIIEGLLPAVNPRGWRQMVEQVSALSDRAIRIGGAVMLLIGAGMFHLVR